MGTPEFLQEQGSYRPSYGQWSEKCNNFRALLVFDPEPKDMYRCHSYHFLEIYKPPVNKPIGSYQIQHLNSLVMGWSGVVDMIDLKRESHNSQNKII